MTESKVEKEFYDISENGDNLDVVDVSSGVEGSIDDGDTSSNEATISARKTVEKEILDKYLTEIAKIRKEQKKKAEENRNEIDKIRGKMKIIDDQLNKINGTNESDGELKKIKDEIDTSKKQIENQKLTIIETLGIFVALFTFISIDFQVFKSYRDPYAVGGLSLILLGSISFLIILFDFYILQARAIKNDSERNDLGDQDSNNSFWMDLKKRYKKNPTGISLRFFLFIFSIVGIILGLTLFCYSRPEKLEDDKQQIKKEILESLETDIENQNKQLQDMNNDNTDIIKSTNANIDEIKKCIRNFGVTYRCFE